MNTDPTERVNLANKYPEKVEELQKLWDKWAKDKNVLLLAGPCYSKMLKGISEPVLIGLVLTVRWKHLTAK